MTHISVVSYFHLHFKFCQNFPIFPSYGFVGSVLGCHEAPFLSLPFAAASLVTPQRWPDFRQGFAVEMCVAVGGKVSPKLKRFLQFIGLPVQHIYHLSTFFCVFIFQFLNLLADFFLSTSRFTPFLLKKMGVPGLSKRFSILMGHLQFNSASNILQVAEKMPAMRSDEM